LRGVKAGCSGAASSFACKLANEKNTTNLFVVEAAFVSTVEIRVLSTHAALDVLNELGPKFERASGHRLSFGYDPAAAVKRQIENGAAFDVAIVTRPVFDALAEHGHILPETRADIGRSGLGVAGRQGAPKPDIATVDAFKRALLAAKSIVRSKEGTSGLYFEKLLGRLGIAEAMRGKIVMGPSGRVAELVARGEADMAVQQIAELLPVTGADFVGPFPPELQLYSVFSAGVATAAKDRAAARAFIDTLTTPAAVALFKAAGLDPI
jgi:molybdate transport system substrate-binding protein